MHFPTFITSLTTLLTVVTAVPVVAQDAAPLRIPTPSKSMTPVASASQSQYATPTVSPVGAYSCPQKQYKACCQSLQETSKGIIKPLGELVPIVGGLQVSSAVSFQCTPSLPRVAPHGIKFLGTKLTVQVKATKWPRIRRQTRARATDTHRCVAQTRFLRYDHATNIYTCSWS